MVGMLMIALGLAAIFGPWVVGHMSARRTGQHHRLDIIGMVNEYYKCECRLCGMQWVGYPEDMPAGSRCLDRLEVTPAQFTGSGTEVTP